MMIVRYLTGVALSERSVRLLCLNENTMSQELFDHKSPRAMTAHTLGKW